jgi:signal transduction histidine kinase
MTIEQGTSKDDADRRALVRIDLLAGATSWLTAGLDLDAMLTRVTELAVPALADGCVVQLLGRGIAQAPERERPQFARLTVAHVDDAVVRRVRALSLEGEAPLHRSFGALEVLRSEQPQHVSDLAREPDDEGVPSLMRELAASEYVAMPLHARGQLIGVLSFVRCSPSRAGLELDHELLHELARHASGAIDNARLYQEAQRAIAARDDLLAVVSHDLQSPLNAISMTVKGLLADPQLTARPYVKRALSLVDRTSKHIGQLCTELMEVGSIQAKRLAVAPRPTALPPLLQEALAILEPLATDKQLRVSTELDPALPALHCDGEQVLRVLMNLIGNAIKFMGSGGELVIAARSVGDQAEISIRDTGPGIAREDLPKLFEPYWRSHHGTRRGMGLGLYIARGIVEAHGGHIWVESELGVGSTFVFRLAIATAESTYAR